MPRPNANHAHFKTGHSLEGCLLNQEQNQECRSDCAEQNCEDCQRSKEFARLIEFRNCDRQTKNRGNCGNCVGEALSILVGLQNLPRLKCCGHFAS